MVGAVWGVGGQGAGTRVLALVVTPEGFPLAYELMPGNTSDNTTLARFLAKIEAQYGRSDRVWIMDRGIPTEETLAAMRGGEAPVHYLVGTPKGRLTRLEQSFVGVPWRAVRESVEVKLLAHLENTWPGRARRDSRRGRSWRSSPPCRWSMSICRPPTGAI